jgi:hypothetical protein
MNRKCKWCGEVYDTEKGSSIFCEKNPHRMSGYSKWKRERGRRGRVVIGCVVRGPNIWAKGNSEHRPKRADA